MPNLAAKLHSVQYRPTARPIHLIGAVMNFCRIRNSGNLGKNTSAMKTLFGARSRVAMVSLYSMCSCGLITTVPGFGKGVIIGPFGQNSSRLSYASKFQSAVRSESRA